jgi:hypothetical protein
MEPGFLYVLTHPSEPNLYKIGVTVLRPEERLAQHNSQLEKYAGQVVARTGQKWELKTYISVTDPYCAEKAFWQATQYSVIPYRNGVEVQTMDWPEVLDGLEAAKLAGVRRPASKPRRNREWMVALLESTPIKMVGHYRGLVTFVEFECVNGHVFKEAPGWIEHHTYCPLCKSPRTQVP